MVADDITNKKITFSKLNIKSIEDIPDLDQFQDIKYLDLSNNEISKISGLGNFRNLTYLNLSNNNISKISGLDNNKNLTYLNLRKNKITEITGLKNLTKLMELNLSDNFISKISSLDSLLKLRRLNLDKNKIKHIDGLNSLIKLTDLSLCDNFITSLSGLSQLRDLNSFKIDNSKLEVLDCFIYCQKNSNSLRQYSEKIENGISSKNIFDESPSNTEKKIEIWENVLSSCIETKIMKIGKYQEDKDLKELQKLFFFHQINMPIFLNKAVKKKDIIIHLIQLHSLKGITIPKNDEKKVEKEDNRLYKFTFFVKCFWDKEIINEKALVYSKNDLTRRRVNSKIDEMLYLSQKSKKPPNIIIFPENSIPKCKVDYLIEHSKINNCIIIGGLEHEENSDNSENSEKFLNKAFIIDNGEIGYQIKQTPVYLEKDEKPYLREPIRCENIPVIKIFKTSLGNISIFICKDFLRLSYGISEWAERNEIDWIIIPSLTMKVLPFYLRLMEIFTYSNYKKLKIIFCNVGEYGGSEYFQRKQLNRIEKEFQSGIRDNSGEKLILREKKL